MTNSFINNNILDTHFNPLFNINNIDINKKDFPLFFQEQLLNVNAADNSSSNSLDENIQDNSINLKTLSINSKKFEYTKSSSKKDKFFEYNNILDININNTSKENNHNLNIKKGRNKKRGRKRKKSPDSFNKQNILTNDNIIRKCKSLVLDSSLEYLNNQIKKIYNGNIGQGMNMKKLLDIGQEQKTDNTINYMRQFIHKTLKEIFSANISLKYTSYLPNYNRIIINRMLNDPDKERKEKLNKIFNLTFKDCLNIFIGNNKYDDIDGFPTFDEVKLKLDEDEKYLDKIKEGLINFEDILKNTIPRKKINDNK